MDSRLKDVGNDRDDALRSYGFIRVFRKEHSMLGEAFALAFIGIPIVILAVILWLSLQIIE